MENWQTLIPYPQVRIGARRERGNKELREDLCK